MLKKIVSALKLSFGGVMSLNSGPHVAKQAFGRRSFLRGAGVAMALPFLDAMRPVFGDEKDAGKTPRRFIGVCNNRGFCKLH